jgi:hypothetical protein
MLMSLKLWWFHFRFRQVLLELMVAVCLACLVWLYTHSRSHHATEHMHVPVRVKLAVDQQEDYALEVADARTVLVSFSGPLSRLREVRRRLQRGHLTAVATLTIAGGKKTDALFRETVRIDEDCLNVPAGVKVEVGEERIPVTVHKLIERTLPVRLECTGEAQVTQIKIEPASVRVRGPKSVLDRASAIPTQPYQAQVQADSSAAGANLRDQVALVSDLDGHPIQTIPAVVQFRCRAVPRQKTHELVDVPISFLCPKDCPWKPRFVTEKDSRIALKLTGPVTEQQPPVLAFVDLTAGNLARGRNLVPLRLQLPKDFQLVESATPLVEFYLDEIDRPAPGQ